MRILQNAGEVIDELGGNRSVHVLFGFIPSAVANWRRDGRFPPDTFLIFTQELTKRGLGAEPKLWKMRTAPTEQELKDMTKRIAAAMDRQRDRLKQKREEELKQPKRKRRNGKGKGR